MNNLKGELGICSLSLFFLIMLKVQAISDLHGHLPELEECDLLLIAGDLCPATNHSVRYQKEWITDKFIPWVDALKCEKVILVAGNHDAYFERTPLNEIKTIFLSHLGQKLEYLQDEGTTVTMFKPVPFCKDDSYVTVENIYIYGTPRCKLFGSWAFMHENHKLVEYYKKIPAKCDILICHDAPDLNNQGLITAGPNKGINAGNHILAAYVLDRQPKYVIHGHIHSANHELTDVDGIKMACVSYIDENYEPNYKPLIFNI